MLRNKWFIATVAVLLTAAVIYDVWYFFLREEEDTAGEVVGSASGVDPGGAAAPASGDAPSPDAEESPEDTAGTASVAGLAEAAARGRPALRDSTVLRAVRRTEGAWGREPLQRTGALAGEPAPPDTSPPPRPATPPDWSLSAVMTGRDRRAAVVDGRVVREGDQVRGGGEVLEIRRGAVVIGWRGRRVVVRLPMPE